MSDEGTAAKRGQGGAVSKMHTIKYNSLCLGNLNQHLEQLTLFEALSCKFIIQILGIRGEGGREGGGEGDTTAQLTKQRESVNMFSLLTLLLNCFTLD